jgi:hypothetical protein
MEINSIYQGQFKYFMKQRNEEQIGRAYLKYRKIKYPISPSEELDTTQVPLVPKLIL